MAGLGEQIAAAIGLMTIVIVAYLATGVGEQVSTALPINASGDFAGVTTGAEILDTNMAILSITILIVIIGGAIRTVSKLRSD